MTTTTAPAARKVFKVLGTTQDVTTCDLCGRDELRGTVRLGALDVDGNVEDVVHYGSACGAKAAGWTTQEIRKQASAADRAAGKVVTEIPAGFPEYTARRYGVTIDSLTVLNGSWVRRSFGKTGVQLVAEYAAC